MNFPQKFRRGQVDRALWHWFVAGKTVSKDPPTPFLTRIRRLLEIDRSGALPRGTHRLRLPRYAFFDAPPDGTGSDTDYAPFNVFCLAIGLDLLDAGFSQLEVVFLIRHLKETLEQQFERAVKYPAIARTFQLHEDVPELPIRTASGIKYADPRIFMLVNKVDVSEQFSEEIRTPIVLRPEFIYGIKALTGELDRLDYNNRRAFVLEMAHTAAQISKLLPSAPVVKRGRQPLQKARRRGTGRR
jgi:hypothetical protein